MKIKKNFYELNSNKFFEIKDIPNYYNDIYNFQYSIKINISKTNQINWKLVKYPILFDSNAPKTLRNKRRQNFRIRCNNYEILGDNQLYYKILNNDNKIIKYKNLIYMKRIICLKLIIIKEVTYQQKE